MKLLVPDSWNDYELLDSGDGRRLERFGNYILNRPDPQAIWKPTLPLSAWQKADAEFTTSWQAKNVPHEWQLAYKDLHFLAKLTPFKHTGIFPEQSANWEWMRGILQRANLPAGRQGGKEQRESKVLNLFGYTGIASLACAAEGAIVTHVDASRPSIGWAKENQTVSHLDEKAIRWILDDAVKFTQRELRRGNRYEGIIMDPPIYGHGPTGEKWDFFEDFPKLLDTCVSLLSEKPLFLLVNAYAISASSIMLHNLLADRLKEGEIESGELALKESKSGRLLSTGIFARWSR